MLTSTPWKLLAVKRTNRANCLVASDPYLSFRICERSNSLIITKEVMIANSYVAIYENTVVTAIPWTLPYKG